MIADNRSLTTKKRVLACLIAATIFLTPFYFFRFKILGIPTNVFDIAVALSFLVALWVDAKGLKQSAGQFGWWPYLLILVALISVLWSTETRDALGIVKGWFVVPISFGIVFNMYRCQNPQGRAWQWALYASALVAAAWGMAQNWGWITTAFYQKNDPTFTSYIIEKRAFGPFDSPNYLAMFLVPALFITLPLWDTIKRQWAKILFALGGLIMVIALSYTQSRAGIIAGGASILLLGMIWWPKYLKLPVMRRAGQALIALVVLANLVYFLIIPRVDVSGGDSVRQDITRYSWQMVREHPIRGVGLGNFQDTIAATAAGDAGFQTFAWPFAMHPHNLALALWLNLGIAGLLIFFVIIWQTAKGLAAAPEGSFYLAALAAILVHGIFDTTYFKNDLSAVFWLIFALSLAQNRRQRYPRQLQDAT